MNHFMNLPVDVTSFYFAPGPRTRSFPKRIEIEGRQLDFLESGLRCLVRKGASIVQIFNMSDGRDLYRLSFEPERGNWTLLSKKSL